MRKFYVDIPYCPCGWGAAMHAHDVVDAENALEAVLKSHYARLEEGAQAVPVPEEMQEKDKEDILRYYKELHEKYGDQEFYKKVMRGMLPRAKQDAIPESERIFRKNNDTKPEWYLEKQRREFEKNIERMRRLR